MSLKTAQENFQKAFLDEKKTITESFIKDLKDYLEKRKNKSRNRAILECIEHNEPLDSFLCRNDICDDLVMEMIYREIPFVLIRNYIGEYGFIIRSSDRSLANEAIRAVLENAGAYCEIVTGDQLIDIVQKSKDRDKGLLAVNGLSFNELKLLEMLCRDRGALKYISQDKQSDGSYRMMAIGKQAGKDNFFAERLFEMMLMTTGKNSAIYLSRIKNGLTVEKLRSCDFGRDKDSFKTIYVVGSDNEYMRIEKTGFSYGHAVRNEEGLQFMSQYEQEITSPGYKEHEMSYLNRIPDPAATTKMEQVQEHFSRRENERDSLDFGMTQKEKDTYFGEKMLLSSVMGVVFRNASNDDIMNIPERWMEKTRHIVREAGRVLSGAIRNEVPIGYSDFDMKEVRNSVAKFNLNISSFKDASKYLNDISITNERGSLVFRGSVQDRVDRIHERIADPAGISWKETGYLEREIV